MKTLDLARKAESIELTMIEDSWAAAPRSWDVERGMQHFRMGGAMITLKPKSTSLQRNRVVGLGVRERATEEMLDAIANRFRAAHVARFSFHVSPCPQSDAMTRWIKARGFILHHRYVKLIRDTRAPVKVATTFHIKRVGKTYRSQFVKVFSEVFPVPDDVRAQLFATFTKPGFSQFLAFNGHRPVATGSVYTAGDMAWMGRAATLVEHRRRGAHTALIAARIKRAAELGAKWIVCETLEPKPRRPGGSYRNLLKLGFEPAYLRPIWVWGKQ
jgi:GNAT superfamily N-acetyltransferase